MIKQLWSEESIGRVDDWEVTRSTRETDGQQYIQIDNGVDDAFGMDAQKIPALIKLLQKAIKR